MTEPIWCVVEIFGHIKIAGRVSEIEQYGTKMLRCDIPFPDGTFVTQFVGGASIFRLMPVSEEIARSVAMKSSQVMPAQPWEIRKLTAPVTVPDFDQDEEEDDYERLPY